jgi:hypothetical protein
MIAEPTGTDGHWVIPKKPSVTGRHDRPVRLQNAWLFSCRVSFFKNRWFKEPLQPCPGCFPHWVAKERCAKETPSREEGMQAGSHRTGRQRHPLGWLAGGTEEAESVLHRIDQGEPLRKVSGDFGVSYEAVRRVIRAARQQ